MTAEFRIVIEALIEEAQAHALYENKFEGASKAVVEAERRLLEEAKRAVQLELMVADANRRATDHAYVANRHNVLTREAEMARPKLAALYEAAESYLSTTTGPASADEEKAARSALQIALSEARDFCNQIPF